MRQEQKSMCRGLALGALVGALYVGYHGETAGDNQDSSHVFIVEEPMNCGLIPVGEIIFLLPPPKKIDDPAPPATFTQVKNFTAVNPDFGCEVEPDGTFKIKIPEIGVETLRNMLQGSGPGSFNYEQGGLPVSGGEMYGTQGNSEAGYFTGYINPHKK